jgi:hypothetical protein
MSRVDVKRSLFSAVMNIAFLSHRRWNRSWTALFRNVLSYWAF